LQRILVTGATGNVGREVVDQLRHCDVGVRALTRNPQKTNLPGDVEVAAGDLSSPDTLDAALQGIDTVFLVWVAPFSAAGPAIARIAAHAKRIVLLTSPHRTPHPFFQQPNALRAVHAGIEQLVENSGADWTFLRPGPFALNCLNWWAPQIRKGNVVRWFYASAETAPIHERDIAAVAVRALCDDGHAGKEYVLTSPQSLTQREQVEIIGDAIGRRLQFDEMPADSAREEMLRVWPPFVADMLLTAYAAAVGQPAYITSTVADVTGMAPRTFKTWANDHSSDFSSVMSDEL
jgi:uncharacterized protein YbjT (DUF2867 family)